MAHSSKRNGRFHSGNANKGHKLHAAYNFVPLSQWVYLPEWRNQVSQDNPLENGLCGHLNLRIHAHSPILVGHQQNRDEPLTFHKIPGGKFAIPGSSLRGMIRNVIEIASFGKLKHVDDQRFGVRDLTNGAIPFYRQYLTHDRGNRTYEPLSKAGWLRFSNGRWTLTPCEHARVEQHELKALHQLDWPGDLKKRPSAAQKYERWTQGNKSLSIRFTPGLPKSHKHKDKQLYYRKATELCSGQQRGMLVFTGQPGPGKHMEFIFFDESPQQSIELSEELTRDFITVHQDSAEWHSWAEPEQSRDPAITLRWRNQFTRGIPVFYLEQDGASNQPKQRAGENIRAVGLAQMFKLTYQHSVGDMINHTSPSHHSETDWDLADLLFGTAHSEDPRLSLRGRADFSPAICTNAQPTQLPPKATILSSPKPTYYPNYVVQDTDNDQLKGREYRTYNGANPEIRGWKRYPARPIDPLHLIPPLEGKQREAKKVQVRLQPLEQGVEFVGKLRFHNLLPEELGALIWALTWGNNPDLRHSIGLGKPLGMGQISIQILDADLRPNKASAKVEAWQHYLHLFAEHMEQRFAENQLDDQPTLWTESEQITQLMAMADPSKAPADPKELSHPKLEVGRNDFLDAKKRLNVLPEYTPYHGRRDRDINWLSQEPGEPGSAASHRWLQQTLQALSTQHHTPEDTVLFGRLLAERWQAIDDQELKQQVLKQIQNRWERAGRWGKPIGKAAKRAKAIYQPPEA